MLHLDTSAKVLLTIVSLHVLYHSTYSPECSVYGSANTLSRHPISVFVSSLSLWHVLGFSVGNVHILGLKNIHKCFNIIISNWLPDAVVLNLHWHRVLFTGIIPLVAFMHSVLVVIFTLNNSFEAYSLNKFGLKLHIV